MTSLGVSTPRDRATGYDANSRCQLGSEQGAGSRERPGPTPWPSGAALSALSLSLSVLAVGVSTISSRRSLCPLFSEFGTGRHCGGDLTVLAPLAGISCRGAPRAFLSRRIQRQIGVGGDSAAAVCRPSGRNSQGAARILEGSLGCWALGWAGPLGRLPQ
jgi:hypothetical protein